MDSEYLTLARRFNRCRPVLSAVLRLSKILFHVKPMNSQEMELRTKRLHKRRSPSLLAQAGFTLWLIHKVIHSDIHRDIHHYSQPDPLQDPRLDPLLHLPCVGRIQTDWMSFWAALRGSHYRVPHCLRRGLVSARWQRQPRGSTRISSKAETTIATQALTARPMYRPGAWGGASSSASHRRMPKRTRLRCELSSPEARHVVVPSFGLGRIGPTAIRASGPPICSLP